MYTQQKYIVSSGSRNGMQKSSTGSQWRRKSSSRKRKPVCHTTDWTLIQTLRKILDEKLTIIKRAAPSQLDEMSKEQLISIIGDLASKVTLLKAAIKTQNSDPAFRAPPDFTPAAADGIQGYNKMTAGPAQNHDFYSHIPVRFPQTTSVLQEDSIFSQSRFRAEQQTQDFRAECHLPSYGCRPDDLSPQDAGVTQIPEAAFLRQSEMNYRVPIPASSETNLEGDTGPPRVRRFENDDLCGFQPHWIPRNIND